MVFPNLTFMSLNFNSVKIFIHLKLHEFNFWKFYKKSPNFHYITHYIGISKYI
jgi:hypothetical protein